MTARHSYSDLERLLPSATSALYAASQVAAKAGLPAELIELLEIRASQINGCAFCLQYHIALARKAGVASEKIDLLATWRESGIFSAKEQAALAWTEALTDVSRHGAPDVAWAALQENFSDIEALGICAAISAINAWNRMAIALRFPPSV